MHESFNDTQSNCLGKFEKTIVGKHLLRAEAGDDNLINICHSS